MHKSAQCAFPQCLGVIGTADGLDSPAAVREGILEWHSPDESMSQLLHEVVDFIPVVQHASWPMGQSGILLALWAVSFQFCVEPTH